MRDLPDAQPGDSDGLGNCMQTKLTADSNVSGDSNVSTTKTDAVLIKPTTIDTDAMSTKPVGGTLAMQTNVDTLKEEPGPSKEKEPGPSTEKKLGPSTEKKPGPSTDKRSRQKTVTKINGLLKFLTTVCVLDSVSASSTRHLSTDTSSAQPTSNPGALASHPPTLTLTLTRPTSLLATESKSQPRRRRRRTAAAASSASAAAASTAAAFTITPTLHLHHPHHSPPPHSLYSPLNLHPHPQAHISPSPSLYTPSPQVLVASSPRHARSRARRQVKSFLRLTLASARRSGAVLKNASTSRRSARLARAMISRRSGNA